MRYLMVLFLILGACSKDRAPSQPDQTISSKYPVITASGPHKRPYLCAEWGVTGLECETAYRSYFEGELLSYYGLSRHTFDNCTVYCQDFYTWEEYAQELSL